MNDLRPEDQARLRRALRSMDDEAPLAPGIADLGVPSVSTVRAHRANTWRAAITVFAGTVLVIAPVALLLTTGSGSPPLGAPTPTTQATTTTTTNVDVTSTRLPLDGRPSDLGVDSVNFVGAVFPASIQEIRMLAVWEAVRSNVESAWVEQCMGEHGFAVEIPRTLAIQLRRQAAIPDFDLDAEFGFFDEAPDDWTALPPSDSTPDVAAAWDSAYFECSVEVEAKRSEQFDQVIGQAQSSWYDIVSDVTASPDMMVATEEMLRCIAEAGGPEVESVVELYSDQIGREADSFGAAVQGSIELAQLIQQCAGDYDSMREGLLVPKRQEILDEFADVLAEAKKYFDEVLAEVGMLDTGE